MKEDNLDTIFDSLKGNFDTEEPNNGHQQRFIEKLQASSNVVTVHKKKNAWIKPWSIAASVAMLCALAFTFFNNQKSIDEKVAEISPEVSKTEFYFANLIEEQVKELQSESTPETKKIIDDTMVQLKKLEDNYKTLEQDLITGGNSKIILSAMITNFQTRINLLQDVLEQITTIKELKNNTEVQATL